jgi:hypothetical protein
MHQLIFNFVKFHERKVFAEQVCSSDKRLSRLIYIGEVSWQNHQGFTYLGHLGPSNTNINYPMSRCPWWPQQEELGVIINLKEYI